MRVQPLLGDHQKTRAEPGEHANPQMMKQEVQIFKGPDGKWAYARDEMSTVIDGGDIEENEPKDAFEYANKLDYVVLRNFNGNGQLVSTGEDDMKETTEQFSWATPKTPSERALSQCGRKMPLPVKRKGRKFI